MNTFKRNGNSAARPIQRPAQKRPQGAQQSQTATTKTTKKVVAGPGGKPVQVVGTSEALDRSHLTATRQLLIASFQKRKNM
jgi:hypothetical protein